MIDGNDNNNDDDGGLIKRILGNLIPKWNIVEDLWELSEAGCQEM